MRQPLRHISSGIAACFAVSAALFGACSRAGDRPLPPRPAAAGALFTAVVPLNDPAAGSEDFFGSSVSLSADGNTALVGSPGASAGPASLAGQAYIFTRSGGTWSAVPAVTFTEPSPQADDEFGFSVALSADGNTALVGSCCTTEGGQSGAGAAYVFTRNGGSWSTTPTAVLREPTAGGNDHFGVAVALAGSTALVGAPDANGSTGAAYLFAQSGGTWQLAASLAGTAGGGGFGTAVTLSGDAATALVGAPTAAGAAGAAYIFTATGGTWTTTPAASLVDPGPGGDGFGSSVALGGSMALIGAPRTMEAGDIAAGAAYIYTASGGVWQATPGTTLTESVPGTHDQFGVSAALSGDGNTAFVGARNGAATSRSYLYSRSGGAWATSPGAFFNEPDPLADANFSSSLALSNDGSTAMLGAPNVVYAIAASAADLLALSMDGLPASVNVGQTFTYDFTVTNDSSAAATGITLTDTLPPQASFSSAAAAGGNCANSNGTITCTLATLAAGGTWQPSITVTGASAGTANDSATVSAGATDPFTANNTAGTSNTVNASTSGGGGGGGSGGGGGALGGLSLLALWAVAWLKRKS